ncbi:MAG: anthranilate phosphoribosyltransferase [Verrucomicrobiales bacterium]|jgi:anthranilate phosphoribosyltransferase|nr:anthranilate phosphoribosyltransferase [Verrucomicrobiales bacterium]
MEALTEKVRSGAELSSADVAAATESLLDENGSETAKADFLAALAQKGETAAEIAAFVNEFLSHAVQPDLDSASISKPLLDVCGTGGDKLNLFNVSTTSVFVLAAAGVAVVKHGNRGITSKSGGADALEALGIRIDLGPEDFVRCLDEVGAGFLFAPHYHPAFKAVVPVRKQLAAQGQRSIFNILGPLLNPVRPDYQLIGVFDPGLCPVFAEILQRLGRKRAWAVHGSAGEAGGMDELSTIGATEVWETAGAGTTPSSFTISPSDLGIAPPSLEDLQGGEAKENAQLITDILAGDLTGPKRDLVCLNAAAGLVITGKSPDLPAGWARANESIDSGAAQEILERWRAFS